MLTFNLVMHPNDMVAQLEFYKNTEIPVIFGKKMLEKEHKKHLDYVDTKDTDYSNYKTRAKNKKKVNFFQLQIFTETDQLRPKVGLLIQFLLIGQSLQYRWMRMMPTSIAAIVDREAHVVRIDFNER